MCRVTVDLIRRSWVQFPPRSKYFFFASCGSLIPFTRANAQWVIQHFNLHFRVNSLFTICVPSATRHNIHIDPSCLARLSFFSRNSEKTTSSIVFHLLQEIFGYAVEPKKFAIERHPVQSNFPHGLCVTVDPRNWKALTSNNRISLRFFGETKFTLPGTSL